jgi:hypothetical protein
LLSCLRVLRLKRNKKAIRKAASRSHKTKTPGERQEYSEKVKLSATEGETVPTLPNKTSTLSMGSVYAREAGTGVQDREPIKPPVEKKEGWAHTISFVGGILGIVVILGGAIVYLTTLKNKVGFNEKEIGRLDSVLSEVDHKREELSTRITKLEQWQEVYSRELEELRSDMRAGMPSEEVEAKLAELENLIHQRTDTEQER